MKNNKFMKEIKVIIEFELIFTFIGLFFWVFSGKNTRPTIISFVILTSMVMYTRIPVLVREWKNRNKDENIQ